MFNNSRLLKRLALKAFRVAIAVFLILQIHAQEPAVRSKSQAWELLQEAVENGNASQAESAIQGGADVNERLAGVLPLYKAISNGYLDVVKILVAGKSDLTFLDERGNTALSAAMYARNNNIVMMEYFLSLPLEPWIVADSLHKSAKLKNTGPLETLLKHGVEVNSPNESKKNMTALMIAAGMGNIKAVQLLLEYKAKKSLKDSNGSSALDHAKKAMSELKADESGAKKDYATVIALLGGSTEGRQLGKVFSVQGKYFDIVGANKGDVRRGDLLKVKTVTGIAEAKVTEVMHTKVKAKIISGVVQKNDAVYLKR